MPVCPVYVCARKFEHLSVWMCVFVLRAYVYGVCLAVCVRVCVYASMHVYVCVHVYVHSGVKLVQVPTGTRPCT